MLALRAWAQPAEGGRGVRLLPIGFVEVVESLAVIWCNAQERCQPLILGRGSRRLSDEASGQGARRARLRRTRSAYTHPPTLGGLPYRCLSTLVRICQTRWPAGGVGRGGVAGWPARRASRPADPRRYVLDELASRLRPNPLYPAVLEGYDHDRYLMKNVCLPPQTRELFSSCCALRVVCSDLLLLLVEERITGFAIEIREEMFSFPRP